jgi:hypothetical protein
MFSTTFLLFIAIFCSMSNNRIDSYKYNTYKVLLKPRMFQTNRDTGGSPINIAFTKNHTELYETLVNDCNDWDSGEVMWDFRDENRTRY